MSWIESHRTDVEVPYREGTHSTAMWTYPPRTSAGDRNVRGAEANSGAADRAGADATRPILLIHGFRGDHHGMDLIAHHVRRHPVIVPDLPGFGTTAPVAGGLSLDAYVEFLDGLVRTVTVEYGAAPLLVGHSFGSILVAHLASRRETAGDPLPDLALINPITAPALEGPARVATAAARLYYAAAAKLPERAGHALLSHPLIVRVMSEVMATTRDPGLRRYIHDQHDRYFSAFSDREALAQAFDVSVTHTVTEVAASLTMPVLVIAGDADAIASQEPTRGFLDLLPDAGVHWFAGVGHLVHYERPEPTARLLEQFAVRPSTGSQSR